LTDDYHLPRKLVYAVADAESGFDVNLVHKNIGHDKHGHALKDGNVRVRGASPVLRAVIGLVSVLLFTASGHQAFAAPKDECFHGHGKVVRKFPGLSIEITPGVDKDALDEPECRLVVRDASGKVILAQDDFSFEILLHGRDVNGDGIRDLVLKEYSGGAHCCWTYYFFSLAPRPGLITRFENDRDASFFEDKTPGQIYMAIEDGAFDYFDGLCHACTPFPLVFLRINGTRLVDVSLEHRDTYDEIIADNRKALRRKDVDRVVSMKQTPTASSERDEAVERILTIVLAYLYSGREDQARRQLQEMWPEFDRERIWKLILETRHNGILCYTRNDAVCGQDSTSE